MRDLSDFQRGHIVGMRLARAFATKMTTLLDVFKVITAYTNHGEASSAMRNRGQKQN